MTTTLAIRCALLAGLTLVSGNCATMNASTAPPDRLEERQIEVSNYNWSTAAVYAVRSGVRTRIGTVETGQTAVLRMPWSRMDAPLNVLVHLIGGGGDYVSPVVPQISDGRVALRVENSLSLSFLTVR
jgi:hypothetical protein